MSILPPDATEASRVRYQLASELAQACPRELAQEIALTGSVSRGVADGDSDIELNFWTDQIPPGSARERWLREMGADPLVVDAMPGADGTAWVLCFMRGIQIEAGWQSIEQQRTLGGELANGNVLDHERLIVAETLRAGISLRSVGLLAEWQAELAEYPPTLGDRLVQQAVERWSWPLLHRALAARGESLAVTRNLLGDAHAVLRILFALNRQWEPDWKWLRHRAGELTITPERLAERIDEIFLTADLVQAVDLCFRLILDTLRLLPPDDKSDHAREIVTDCLRHPGR